MTYRKWEYKIEIWSKTIVPIEGMVRDVRPDVESWMNGFGEQGWEVFAIQQQVTAQGGGLAQTIQVAINLKREKPPTIN